MIIFIKLVTPIKLALEYAGEEAIALGQNHNPPSHRD